ACAGLRQTNHCDGSEAVSDRAQAFRVPACDRDPRAVDRPNEVLLLVDLDGVSGATTVAVEAVDRLCPFVRALGSRSPTIGCVNERNQLAPAVYEGSAIEWQTCPETFPIRTEEEIRADYGSLIINGHRPPAVTLGPAPHQSPFAKLALPAEPD